MKMYDIEVCLNGDDIWLVQNDGSAETATISLHPDQVDLVCQWLKDAARSIRETDVNETQR